MSVEVLSASNTPREMQRKLVDYFDSGVELVWFVDAKARRVEAFTAPDASAVYEVGQTLTGGTVLPRFRIKLRDLFAALDGR